MPSERDDACLAGSGEGAPAPGEAPTGTLVLHFEGRRHSVACEPGETILDAARRAGLRAPFSCQRGNCGTCIAFVAEGDVAMRDNNVLDADEVEEGWVLTCQGVPTSARVVVDYDR